jgi:molybdopterin-containing oxidoreductase family iron-sulfur binding subunit
VVPLARQADSDLPGEFRQHATMLELGGIATGVLVSSYDGRPLKVEGSPAHPSSLGGTTAFAQASVRGLYDPDRSRGVLRRQGSEWVATSWDEYAKFAHGLRNRLRTQEGRGLGVLLPSASSPTRARLLARLANVLPEARVYEYESWSRDQEFLGNQLALGRPCRPLWSFDRARVLLCLDGDPCSQIAGLPAYARDLSMARDPERGEPARVHVVESAWSLTGSLAHRRLPLPSSRITAFAMTLDAALTERLDSAQKLGPAQRRPELAWLGASSCSDFLRELVEDLVAHAGRSLVVVGRQQPPGVHALGHRMNFLLGNVGQTIRYLEEPGAERPLHIDSLRELGRELADGRVEALVLLGNNPVYDAPSDLRFAEAMSHARIVVHAGLYRDETAALATWHLPLAHPLEAWGDGRAHDGTLSVAQPIIEPLHGGRSALEILALLIGESPPTGRELVRATHRELLGDETRWRRAVHDGLVRGTGLRELELSLRPLPAFAPELGSELELTFSADCRLYDGRYANLATLQELPDPVTTLAWGNAALVAPETAGRLGVRDGDEVTLSVGGRSLALPVLLVPGQAANSVRVTLGHGRRRAGRVGGLLEAGVPPVGADAGQLRTSSSPFVAQGLTMSPTGRRVDLATITPLLADDRLGREATRLRAPELVRELAWQPLPRTVARSEVSRTAPGQEWGMAVDLDRCIGCQACVLACRVENNVPVVGQVEVRRGRELSWLRVNRYFTGPPAAPKLVWQPLMCQECDRAPCEKVCPVGATLHTTEGLNDMVYSRCVGARFCANNCPYQVRRFNYLDYAPREHSRDLELIRLGLNPEVSVRSRGVMEKCTFCVQRIQRMKIRARSTRRSIADGELQTACAQACPTGALVFGDLADPNSRVSRLHALPRAYALLADLDTRPRVRYLARVTHRRRS